MTRDEFKQLPHLIREPEVVALGFGRRTVLKFVDCGVLARICPAGCGEARYQKKQCANLLHWEDLLDTEAFRMEPPALELKAVIRWTGWDERTLTKMVKARGLTFVKPPGAGKGKYLKGEIATLIGFYQFV